MNTFINAARMFGDSHEGHAPKSGFDLDRFVEKLVKKTAYKQAGSWEKADNRNVDAMIKRCQKAGRIAMDQVAGSTDSPMRLDIGRKVRVLQYLVKHMTDNINFKFGQPMQQEGHLVQEVGPIFIKLSPLIPLNNSQLLSALMSEIRVSACKLVDRTENFCFVAVDEKSRPWIRLEITRGYVTDTLQTLNGPLEAVQVWVRYHQRTLKRLGGYSVKDVKLTRPKVKPMPAPHSPRSLSRHPSLSVSSSPTAHGHRCTANPSFEDDHLRHAAFRFQTPSRWRAKGDVAIVSGGNSEFGATRTGSMHAAKGLNYVAIQGTGSSVKQQVLGKGSHMVVNFYASGRDGYAPCKLGVYVDGHKAVQPIKPGIGWENHQVHIPVNHPSGQSMSLEFRNDGGEGLHAHGDVTVFLDAVQIVGGACEY